MRGRRGGALRGGGEIMRWPPSVSAVRLQQGAVNAPASFDASGFQSAVRQPAA